MNALPDRYASDELVLRDPSDGRTLAQRLTKRYAARITGAFVVPGREGSFAPLPDDLPPALAQALRSRGIEQLYSHQAEAWAATQSGAHVAIVTPTASGKSPLIDTAFARWEEPVAHRRLLHFDTETTGLAGGTGTRAWMIGAVDWLTDGRFRVRQQ